jgi:hypothetical protein
VLDAELGDASCVHLGAIRGPVVGHHTLDRHAKSGEEADGSAQERDTGRTLLVVKDLDIGQPRGVIDRNVAELKAAVLARSAYPALRFSARKPGRAKRPSFLTSTWMSSPGWRRQ